MGQGYLGKTNKNGTIATPAITVKDTMSNAQDLPNKVVAGAATVPEVITSVVSSTVSQSLQKGIASSKSSSDSSSSNGSSGAVSSSSGNISNAKDLFQGGGSGGGGATRGF